MTQRLILASASKIRLKLLQQAGLDASVKPASIDEDELKVALTQNQTKADLIAEHLAVAKAKNVSEMEQDAIVVGADQTLLLGDDIMSKPATPDVAIAQLMQMQGRHHTQVSAVAVAAKGNVVWQASDIAHLDMRVMSKAAVERYVQREWDKIRWTVGCYMIEDRGIALFKSVRGDYHTVLGLPVFKLLTYLEQRGAFSV